MPISGKYDFKGIKTQGAQGILGVLAANPKTVWLTKVPLIRTLIEFLLNYLANNGLILLNVGAFYIGGEFDQAGLDKAIDEGLKRVESGEKLTPEQMKEIDDAVIKAADKALPYGKRPSNP